MRKAIIFLLSVFSVFFIFTPLISYGAVVFESVTTTTWGVVTSKSFSHTNTSGDALVLNSNNNGSLFLDQTTKPTYNGVSMTFIHNPSPGNGGKGEQWYLLAPATGTNTVVLTFSGTTEAGNAAIMSLTGVATSDAIGTTYVGTGPGTPYSKEITTVGDNSMIVVALRKNSTTVNAAATGTNQTLRHDIGGIAESSMAGSTQTTSGAGNYTNSFTFADASVYVGIFEIKASAVAATPVAPQPIIIWYD